jgi:hypothetical protein
VRRAGKVNCWGELSDSLTGHPFDPENTFGYFSKYTRNIGSN